MTLLSIGEFARLSRLSAKALRRYDELDLLRPERVDPDSGYRWYGPGAPFAIYHGEVSADSDGPVEWCRPVPAAEAEALAAGYPELTLRTEPAHHEAYVHLGDTQATPPQWPLVAEALYGWGAAQGRQASDLGPRVTFLATPPRLPGSAPDSDYAVPLR
jgi:MerR family regulatory protein